MDIAQITIAESDKLISLQEFVTYLTLFQSAYDIGANFRSLSIQEILNEQDNLAEIVRNAFSGAGLAGVPAGVPAAIGLPAGVPAGIARRAIEFFEHVSGEDEIQLIEITKSSPIELLIGGSLILLTFAVVLSGGE